MNLFKNKILLAAMVVAAIYVGANLFYNPNTSRPVTFKQNYSVNPSPTPQKQKESPSSKIFLSPTPIPERSATTDTTAPVWTGRKIIEVLVPKGSKYVADPEGKSMNVEIQPTTNLTIQMCWGCQPIGAFSKCGGSYGMSGEGNCEAKPITLAGMVMQEHRYLDNGKMALISGPVGKDLGKMAGGFVWIETINEKFLTSQEKQITERIIKSVTENTP